MTDDTLLEQARLYRQVERKIHRLWRIEVYRKRRRLSPMQIALMGAYQ